MPGPVRPRQPREVVVLVVVVAVAGAIFVGHDGEDAYGHGNVHDDVYDHHCLTGNSVLPEGPARGWRAA